MPTTNKPCLDAVKGSWLPIADQNQQFDYPDGHDNVHRSGAGISCRGFGGALRPRRGARGAEPARGRATGSARGGAASQKSDREREGRSRLTEERQGARGAEPPHRRATGSARGAVLVAVLQLQSPLTAMRNLRDRGGDRRALHCRRERVDAVWMRSGWGGVMAIAVICYGCDRDA